MARADLPRPCRIVRVRCGRRSGEESSPSSLERVDCVFLFVEIGFVDGAKELDLGWCDCLLGEVYDGI